MWDLDHALTIQENLHRLHREIETLVQTRKTHTFDKYIAVQEALKKQRASVPTTADEEALVRSATGESQSAEATRVTQVHHAIATQIRRMLPEIVKLILNTAFNHPETRGIRRAFQELVADVPEDPEETKWILDFLLDVEPLVRNALKKVSIGSPANNNIKDQVHGQTAVTRKRGRPALPEENKRKALELLDSGAEPEKVARVLYGDEFVRSKIKNIYAILKQFKKTRGSR